MAMAPRWTPRRRTRRWCTAGSGVRRPPVLGCGDTEEVATADHPRPSSRAIRRTQSTRATRRADTVGDEADAVGAVGEEADVVSKEVDDGAVEADEGATAGATGALGAVGALGRMARRRGPLAAGVEGGATCSC